MRRSPALAVGSLALLAAAVVTAAGTAATAAPLASVPPSTPPPTPPAAVTPAGTVPAVEPVTVPPPGPPSTTPSAPGATAAGTTPGTAAGSTPGSTPAGDPFHWKPFAEGVDGRTQEGTLTVPLDYAHPEGATVELYLLRHLADPAKRIGTMLVNPGGPGFGGSFLVSGALSLYSPELVEAFDIVAWDPRGTGLSTPAIDCIGNTDYDRFYASPDVTPDTPEERQQILGLAKEFATDCATKNASIIQFIGTNNSARDMDAIRRALGERTLTYFGFSYGSELGATWATMFPTTVRAAVLDGASDPTATAFQSALQQTVGFEHTLNTFLQRCAASATCPFHHGGASAAAFDRLMMLIDQRPIPSVAGRPPVNRGVALQAVAEAMYSQGYWDQLAQALDDAQHGKGAGLLDLFDQYYDRHIDGTYDNSLEAFQTISCMDTADRETVAQEDADAAAISAAAPRMSPAGSISYFCTFFPKPDDPRVAITGAGAGPILVMGTTGDPATPLDSSRNMAKALQDGRLVIVHGDQHTGYDINACSRSTIDQYLLDPVQHAPADNTECR